VQLLSLLRAGLSWSVGNVSGAKSHHYSSLRLPARTNGEHEDLIIPAWEVRLQG
jgi:hypothetical protein